MEPDGRPFRAAVFLDRDGTVIEERHYLASPEGVVLIAGAGSAIARLNASDVAVVLVTNQSGVARGFFTEASVRAVHARLCEELERRGGGRLDAIYHCPHHEEGRIEEFRVACTCRKPRPGMVERARAELRLAALPSFVVGDKEVDLDLARAVGATPVLVRTGYGGRLEPELQNRGTLPPSVADDLSAAVDWILERLGNTLEPLLDTSKP